MTLNKLQKDMIQAMKSGDKAKKEALSSVISSIKKNAIDEKIKDTNLIPDNIVDKCLIKEKKTIQEMIDSCPEDRIELKNKYTNRLYIINQYCPQLIDDPTVIEGLVLGICRSAGYTLAESDRGNIMKTVMPQLKGKVDMKIANQVITKLLKS